MELHQPKNFDLPPLVLEKISARVQLEKNEEVKKLIDSKLLLDKEFFYVLDTIKNLSEEIERTININKNNQEYKTIFVNPNIEGNNSFKYPLILDSFETYYRSDFIDNKIAFQDFSDTFKKYNINEKYIIPLNKSFIEIRNKQSIENIKKKSELIETTLWDFENPREIKLHILTKNFIYLCKNCSNIISVNEFESKNCSCSQEIIQPSDTEQLAYYSFNNSVMNFLSNNYWFEHGVDYLLRKCNYSTKCGYYVLGHSGIKHEIDIISWDKKNKFRFFCECKVGVITPNDILIFSGKMTDIGCIKGFCFTSFKTDNKDVHHLARSRNIRIISDVRKKNVDCLIEEFNNNIDWVL